MEARRWRVRRCAGNWCDGGTKSPSTPPAWTETGCSTFPSANLSSKKASRSATSRAGSSLASTSCPCRCGVRCARRRSEEHTSELQSRLHLVCRLLLEKKKKKVETQIE